MVLPNVSAGLVEDIRPSGSVLYWQSLKYVLVIEGMFKAS
jgi:hypothetical protein